MKTRRFFSIISGERKPAKPQVVFRGIPRGTRNDGSFAASRLSVPTHSPQPHIRLRLHIAKRQIIGMHKIQILYNLKRIEIIKKPFAKSG